MAEFGTVGSQNCSSWTRYFDSNTYFTGVVGRQKCSNLGYQPVERALHAADTMLLVYKKQGNGCWTQLFPNPPSTNASVNTCIKAHHLGLASKTARNAFLPNGGCSTCHKHLPPSHHHRMHSGAVKAKAKSQQAAKQNSVSPLLQSCIQHHPRALPGVGAHASVKG